VRPLPIAHAFEWLRPARGDGDAYFTRRRGTVSVQIACICCCLQNASTGATSCVINNVSTTVDLGFCKLATLHRIVPSCTGGTGHVFKHFQIWVGCFCTLLIATSKSADQWNVHTTNEAHFTGFRSFSSQKTNKVGAFVLFEDHRANVWQINDHVDDSKLGVWEFRSHFLQCFRMGETDNDDRVVALLSEAAHRLLTLGVILNFEIAVSSTGIFQVVFRYLKR